MYLYMYLYTCTVGHITMYLYTCTVGLSLSLLSNTRCTVIHTHPTLYLLLENTPRQTISPPSVSDTLPSSSFHTHSMPQPVPPCTNTDTNKGS